MRRILLLLLSVVLLFVLPSCSLFGDDPKTIKPLTDPQVVTAIETALDLAQSQGKITGEQRLRVTNLLALWGYPIDSGDTADQAAEGKTGPPAK